MIGLVFEKITNAIDELEFKRCRKEKDFIGFLKIRDSICYRHLAHFLFFRSGLERKLTRSRIELIEKHKEEIPENVYNYLINQNWLNTIIPTSIEREAEKFRKDRKKDGSDLKT